MAWPTEAGETQPMPGDSSASMMRESPTWISACMILPSGLFTRMVSRAPKARW